MKTPTALTKQLGATLAVLMWGLLPVAATADPAHPQGMMMHGAGAQGPGMMDCPMTGDGMGMMWGSKGMMGGGMGMMGHDHGMMGYRSLNLSKEQRSKINRISDDTRKKHWELMGKMQDVSNILRDLYDADKWDSAEIGKTYQKIYDLKRQMIESSVEAHNRMDDVLTKEQREQFKKVRPRGGMMWQEP